MIQNLIFDIGMVLVDFRWKELMRELGITGSVFDHVARATVQGPYWNEFDRSRIPAEELIQMCCDLDPEYAPQIRLYFDHIGEICREYPDSAGWIRAFQDAGYRIYLLSNYEELAFTRATPPFSFLSLVDGRVISYEVREIKPEPAIYQILLQKYDLRAEECVFIDDNEENIRTAQELGFHTVHYRSRQQTNAELAKLLKKLPE